MTKIEFTDILTELGFELGYNNWFLRLGEFDSPVQLIITFIDEVCLQLSIVKLSKGMQTGKSFGIFDLKTFGNVDDIQMSLFLSFLNGSFVSETGTPNTKITKYIRNNKIEDILVETPEEKAARELREKAINRNEKIDKLLND